LEDLVAIVIKPDPGKNHAAAAQQHNCNNHNNPDGAIALGWLGSGRWWRVIGRRGRGCEGRWGIKRGRLNWLLAGWHIVNLRASGCDGWLRWLGWFLRRLIIEVEQVIVLILVHDLLLGKLNGFGGKAY
jgi:hypothetical protein